MCKRQILFFLLQTFFSFQVQANEIVINQKDQVTNAQQIFPVQLVRTDGKPIKFEDTFLIGASFVQNQQEGVDGKLESSKRRPLLLNHEETLGEFWDLFEKRTQELGVEINTDVTTEVFPYENNVHTNPKTIANPVQKFLIERLGVAVFTSKELYSSLQIGYRMRGLEGAKDAFKESLNEMLYYEIIFLAGDFVVLSEVLSLKLQDELLQQHSNRSDKSSRLANLLISIAYGDEAHPAKALILHMLRTKNIPLENQEIVRQFLIDNLDVLINTTLSDSFMSVLSTREDRYRAGIEAEKLATGVPHANGPKSVRANVNKRILQIIHLKGLLGETWTEANNSVNTILENSQLIIENRAGDILGLVRNLTDKANTGLSCKSLLLN